MSDFYINLLFYQRREETISITSRIAATAKIYTSQMEYHLIDAEDIIYLLGILLVPFRRLLAFRYDIVQRKI